MQVQNTIIMKNLIGLIAKCHFLNKFKNERLSLQI